MPYVVPPAAAKLSVCHLYRLHPPHITLVYGMAEFRTRFMDAAYSISASGMFSGKPWPAGLTPQKLFLPLSFILFIVHSSFLVILFP